ncbi:MAG: class I adenylate-forming enzyme family protein [Sulfitobacter sp.]
MSYEINPSSFNLAQYVLARGARSPDKIALSLLYEDHTEEWRYDRLIASVRGIAAGLLQSGLVAGDIVLMRLGNTPDFPLAYLGALAAGLVPVPTSSALTQAEVAGMIATLAPRAVLLDPVVACPAHDNIIPLSELRTMRDLPPADWHLGQAERPGYIVFTSGTSGKPAAVLHAHRAILARRMMFDGWYGLGPEDRMLHAGAFNWTYTLGTGLMDPWTVGATALIPAPGTAPADLPALLRTHRATLFAAAPGVFRQILASDADMALPDLRHGLSAGEKMATPVRAAWERATDRQVYEAFGMSECSTFISSCPSRPAQGSAVGCAQQGRKVAILDAAGPVADGTPGTIAIDCNDPGLMLGYFGAPDETAKRFQGQWFLTGDQGVRDSDGQITYLGRADDMMNAGGFRVSPLEVEAALATIPGVSGIGVAEVEVKPDVHVIAAFYTGPAPLDDAALQAYAKDKLARYKQPRLYIHLPELPTGANGKLQRRALRVAFEASRT